MWKRVCRDAMGEKAIQKPIENLHARELPKHEPLTTFKTIRDTIPK
jgi:hypothetical protein